MEENLPNGLILNAHNKEEYSPAFIAANTFQND